MHPAQHSALSTQHFRPAYFGVTTITHDLAEIHESDRLLVNGLVLGSIFVILLALVRRPLFALYLLLTVLFSYYVTIGGIQLLSTVWLHVPLGEVDWKVPYFLFTILVSVGEDYNIFLLTRVFEESRRWGLRQGTQRALASTGATITSCGLIMAGAFATMTLCTLTTLVQLGMALALGVLLDTFLVRPILVPAFLLMTSRERSTSSNQPSAFSRQRSAA
jgi:RND superfamily putative drug exporter